MNKSMSSLAVKQTTYMEGVMKIQSVSHSLRAVLCVLAAGLMLACPITVKAAGQDLTLLGGGTGGLWAILAEGVGETIRRSIPDARVTVEPGKDGPNQVLTSRKQVQLALANENLTINALAGKPPFKGKLENLRTVAVINPTTTVQFIIDAKTGITSIQDIKDKKYPLRVCVNRAGTLIDIASEEIFKAYGFSYADIESWGGKIHKIPGPEAMDMWDAGQMDAIIEVSQYPTSRFTELGQKHKLRMLSIDADKQEALNKALGTTSITMEANAYPFQPEPCPTLNTKLIIITSADQPDELIGGVVKAMVANMDYLHNVHANLKALSPEVMAKDSLIPLHPGAEKVYREIGALK